MSNIFDEYLTYHNDYSKKYGPDKTLILMQVGSFYEAYATEDKGPDLHTIAGLLNTACTKKDKKKELSIKNPHMMGFPKSAEAKFINLIIEKGYTVVLIDQVTPAPDPKREVVDIRSPGTYIDGPQKQDNNFVVSLFIEEEQQKNGINLICAGMIAIDITTGEILINEAYATSADNKYALDETVRFLNGINPSEIMIHIKAKKESKEEIIKYLDLGEKIVHIKDIINPSYFKISYQNEFLKKIYPDCGQIQPIDYLDLEKYIYVRVGLIVLIDFIYNHNKNIINNLNKPEIYCDTGNMVLGNNAINQLNVVESSLYENTTKYKSLFNVVNNTSTSMGRRLLKSRLVLPLVSHTELNKEYCYIEELMKNKLFEKIEGHLKQISDIQRLERKISLGCIQPFELSELIPSYEETINIIKNIKKNTVLKSIIINTNIQTELEKFIVTCNDTFIYDELKKHTLNEISTNIFMPNIFEDLDDLQIKINFSKNFMNDLCTELSKYINDKKSAKKDAKITIKNNDRDGYYLSMTKIRASNLKKNLQAMKIINIGNYKLELNKLVFKDITNITKITFPELVTKSDEVIELQSQMMTLTKKYYLETINKLYTDNKNLLNEITKLVAMIDLYKSNAKTAALYNYKKPVIDSKSKNSYIECSQLRHPIIERIIDYEYIPHDVSLGKEIKGMLIMGLNSSGKCFDPNTPILMFNGSIKKAKMIQSGEQLMGDDSTARNVLGTTVGTGMMYKIIPETGSSFIVNGPHILCLKKAGIIPNDDIIIEISVDDYIKKSSKWKSEYCLYRVAVDFPEKKISANPYHVGYSLGNDIINSLPFEYKCNTKSIRTKLFTGILDSECCVRNNYGIEITLKNEKLLDDIMYLGQSLGYSCNKKVIIDKVNISDIKYKAYITTNNVSTYSFFIEKLGDNNYCGFETDGNKRFLLGDFTVTHNSSLMKAIGLCVIMAQAGMFVPVSKCTIAPYTSLYTRITSNDNLFKGLSSFAVEMLELKAILRRSSARTLVIGDEVCRGTEHISGNSIVATTIIKLHELGSNFIFATHLHEIAHMERIKKINEIKCFHLSVSYDNKTDNLIYDRKLKEGPGEPIYGITVAKYIINDKDFTDMALEIKNELMNDYGSMLSGKTSKYNSQVYIHECQICHKKDITGYIGPLQTHHINFQADCVNGFAKDKQYIKKNDKANLIVLCTECHDKVHHDGLDIKGFVMTSKGKKVVLKDKST
jgi:DNA mismatch repair ATPase MutS